MHPRCIEDGLRSTSGGTQGCIVPIFNTCVNAIVFSIQIQQLRGGTTWVLVFLDPRKQEEDVMFDCLSWTERSDLNVDTGDRYYYQM